MPCWEQQASAKEMDIYEKRGMIIDRKIYFIKDPKVTERHEIIITKRNGVFVKQADTVVLNVVTVTDPDASAGLGVLFKIMVRSIPGVSKRK